MKDQQRRYFPQASLPTLTGCAFGFGVEALFGVVWGPFEPFFGGLVRPTTYRTDLGRDLLFAVSCSPRLETLRFQAAEKRSKRFPCAGVLDVFFFLNHTKQI